MLLRSPLPVLGLGGLLLALVCQAAAEPLSQAQIVQLALEHHPRIEAARQSWEAARARIWPARLFPNPELSFEYEALPDAPSLSGFGERSIGVAQTVEFPVKPYLRGRVAQQEAHRARLEYEAIRIAITAEAQQLCAQVLAGQRRLEYADERLRLALEFRDRTQVRMDAGDAARAEVLRAVVETGRAKVEKAAAQQQLGQARSALNTLLNRDPASPLELIGDLEYTPVQFDLQRLQQQALDSRPDLRGFAARLEGAQALHQLSAYGLVPDLELSAASQQIRGEGDYWKAGFRLRVPLWAWGKERGEIAAAQAEVARVRAEQAAARNQGLLEVQDAFLKVEIAQQQFLLYRDQVMPSAEEAYHFTRRRYDEGGASYLEVIDAGRTLAEVRSGWVDLLLTCHTALAELERSIGGNQLAHYKENIR